MRTLQQGITLNYAFLGGFGGLLIYFQQSMFLSTVTSVTLFLTSILISILFFNHLANRHLKNEWTVKTNAHKKHIDSIIAAVHASSESLSLSSDSFSQLVQDNHSNASDISLMMDGVAGMAQKNSELTEKSSEQMAVLNENLDEIHTYTKKLDEVSASTQMASVRGQSAITDLITKTDHTSKAIEKLGLAIGDVARQMDDMNKITESILNVSNRTQLLSINASIEAARAGIHGKGFAVVAEEIGQLADQSRQSSTEIQGIINDISASFVGGLEIVNQVEGALEDQIQTISSTLSAFNKIGISVVEIGTGIDVIGDLVIQVRQVKDDLVHVLKQVSMSSRMTSSTTQQVTAAGQAQRQSIEQVSNLCSDLKQVSANLIESTQQLHTVHNF